MVGKLKCDFCGKFIPYSDLEAGRAIRRFITPDSDRSREEYETLCRDHIITEAELLRGLQDLGL